MFVDRRQHVQGIRPAGWHYYRDRLSDTITARDQLAFGTFNHHQNHPSQSCAAVLALKKVGEHGAMLFIVEFHGAPASFLARVPNRPDHFRLPPSNPRLNKGFGRSYLFRFKENGRGFQAHLTVGLQSSPARTRQALQILDSLDIPPVA